jgi:hypothetical protein
VCSTTYHSQDRKTKKHIYLGIGFTQRQDAFDLRASLDDQIRRLARMNGGGDSAVGGDDADRSDATATSSNSGLNRKLEDMTLKEGQKIKINLNIGGGSSRARAEKSDTGCGGGVVPLLAAPSLMVPPPPAATATIKVQQSSNPAVAADGVLNPPVTPSAVAEPAVQENGAAPAADDDDDDWGDFQ